MILMWDTRKILEPNTHSFRTSRYCRDTPQELWHIRWSLGTRWCLRQNQCTFRMCHSRHNSSGSQRIAFVRRTSFDLRGRRICRIRHSYQGKWSGCRRKCWSLGRRGIRRSRSSSVRSCRGWRSKQGLTRTLAVQHTSFDLEQWCTGSCRKGRSLQGRYWE